MTMDCSLADIGKAFRDAESILLIAHIQPDGDTLGSTFALRHILTMAGKSVDVACDDGMPQRYATLFEGCRLVQPDEIGKTYSLVAAVDCADKNRLGKLLKVFKKAPLTVNIDHHVTNDRFAQLNYITEASSTGEIIFELAQSLGGVFDEASAKYLYIAISTDTGNFTYSNTNRKCMAYVSELVELFDLRDTADVLFRRRSLVATKLIARALSRLELDMDGRIAYLTLLQSDLTEIGATGADCENIVDFAREIEETKVAVFFRQLDTGVKVSLRSKGSYDVGSVAAAFGGGGHPGAAGCCPGGTIEEVKRSVLEKVRELF
jgi:phosphoesterase RecJ-like protein